MRFPILTSLITLPIVGAITLLLVPDGDDHARGERVVKNVALIVSLLVFAETLSNPLLRLVDVPALVNLCRERGCRLIVDNTFATPVLSKPLDWNEVARIIIEAVEARRARPHER